MLIHDTSIWLPARALLPAPRVESLRVAELDWLIELLQSQRDSAAYISIAGVQWHEFRGQTKRVPDRALAVHLSILDIEIQNLKNLRNSKSRKPKYE